MVRYSGNFPCLLIQELTSNNRHGIAFDDGALNRVVEPGKDDEELQKLDLFLFGAEGGSTSYPAAVRNLYLS